MRKLSIDELPQLFCVLVGSMSMVGPRPALPDEVEQWDDEVRDRLRVPPGLTGMWQVNGRSDSSFETYKQMDLYYVDNWSLTHDLMICAKTVRVRALRQRRQLTSDPTGRDDAWRDDKPDPSYGHRCVIGCLAPDEADTR